MFRNCHKQRRKLYFLQTTKCSFNPSYWSLEIKIKIRRLIYSQKKKMKEYIEKQLKSHKKSIFSTIKIWIILLFFLRKEEKLLLSPSISVPFIELTLLFLSYFTSMQHIFNFYKIFSTKFVCILLTCFSIIFFILFRRLESLEIESTANTKVDYVFTLTAFVYWFSDDSRGILTKGSAMLTAVGTANSWLWLVVKLCQITRNNKVTLCKNYYFYQLFSKTDEKLTEGMQIKCQLQIIL